MRRNAWYKRGFEQGQAKWGVGESDCIKERTEI
jgi:hypothetical protein